MRRYLVVLEKSVDGYGAYCPDLPGCVAVGETKEEAERLIYEAITFHIDGLKEEGMPIPVGESAAEYLLLPEAA